MMKNRDDKDRHTLGVYVHIPFCVRKCRYCDFLSFPAEADTRRRYLDALCQEMALWKERMSGCEVDTVFLGGGTPSLLTVEETAYVLDSLQKCFSLQPGAEFTIECNPGTVSPEKLSLYRRSGVNRISFGLQSAVDAELARLGRIHTYGDFLHSYHLAREAGFEQINIDVMSAIPGQTRKSCEETLKAVIALKPEHISSYSLILEEGTPFYEQYRDKPPVDEELDRQMYELTGELLSRAGYERYEISNYAQKGAACRHNLKYWQRLPYLGLGLGAASFLEHTRFSNERELASYEESVRNHRLPVAEKEILSTEDEKAEFMYLGLRCMRGVSLSHYRSCFGEELTDRYGEEIDDFVRQGLLAREGDRIRLTNRGIDVSNRVFVAFL